MGGGRRTLTASRLAEVIEVATSPKTDSPDGPKPFLRWAGSKRRLLPKLMPFWSGKYRRYIEPFMGSAALFFAVRPAAALLGDINPDLVETFLTVCSSPVAVHDALQQLPIGERAYYEIRQRASDSMTRIERAARFIFLNRFCFNGLYRTNLRGGFNVPFSPAKTGPLPAREELKCAARLLRTARIRCTDFEECLAEAARGDFVYLDPPYAVSNRRMFRQYGPCSFGIEDLSRLTAALTDLDRRGVHFVIRDVASEYSSQVRRL